MSIFYKVKRRCLIYRIQRIKKKRRKRNNSISGNYSRIFSCPEQKGLELLQTDEEMQ